MTSELIPFLSAKDIEKIVGTLADQISKEYKEKLQGKSDLTIVVILKGAMFFAADLIRRLSLPLGIEFVTLASYGGGTKTTGKVRILKDIETDPLNRHILILDEIADSGHTLSFLKARLEAARPSSVKICTLLSKPSRRELPIEVDFLGREVEDKFLVGYGLDFNERYRNLPDIYILKGGGQ